MIIDGHTHIVPEHFPPVGDRAAGDRWPAMEHAEPGKANVIIGGRNFRTVRDVAWSVASRTGELEGLGVDRQVVSPMPALLAYKLEPQDGLDLARVVNEAIARMMDEAPDRFYGLGSVPMQDVEMATAELSRVKALGLQGVEVLTNINGRNIGEPEFQPFLKEAEAIGASIFVHAQAPTFADRFTGVQQLANNGIGIPIESGLAAASVITGGVMEECPNLRILFSHGGGVLTQALGRIESTWERNAAAKEALPKAPSEYAGMCYFDDIFFNNAMVRYLIDTVGATQVMVGSDYPFMTGNEKPSDRFDAVGLTGEDRENVSHRNCLRFLGIES